MADKLSEVYSAYDMTVLQVCRGRESNLLKTDKGIRQLKRFNQSERRLESERCFKNELYEEGFTSIHTRVANSFEALTTHDRYAHAPPLTPPLFTTPPPSPLVIHSLPFSWATWGERFSKGQRRKDPEGGEGRSRTW